MTKVLVIKSPSGYVCADEESQEFHKGLRLGEVVSADISRPRNIGNHRRWFALAKIAYDSWENELPSIEYKGMKVQASFDRFRQDLVIQTGRYRPVFNMKGEMRIEADSISFASMTEDEFQKLFSQTIDVILAKILTQGNYTKEKLESLCEQVVGFS